MTARTLITRILQSCHNIDEEYPVVILVRDQDNCVIKRKVAKHYLVGLNKIYVEDDFTEENV